MRLAVKIMSVTGAIALLGVTLLPTGPSNAASGEEVIKSRIEFMKKEIYAHFKVLAAYAKKGTGTLSDVEKHASAISNVTKQIPSHFPKDTGRGNYPDEMTRSLPAIWTDWKGFEKAAQKLEDGTAKLARAAKEGDKDAVVALIGTSGKYSKTQIGCAECHKQFQGAKVKK